MVTFKVLNNSYLVGGNALDKLSKTLFNKKQKK